MKLVIPPLVIFVPSPGMGTVTTRLFLVVFQTRIVSFTSHNSQLFQNVVIQLIIIIILLSNVISNVSLD